MNAPRPGDVLLGKYRVERVLGAGGMGVVVSALHIQMGERVAMKFLLPAAAARPDLVTRFVREARAAAKIKSEHVVRAFDVGTLDDGAPYLVMEHLEGKDLGALLKGDGPLPIATAVGYLLQACEALAEAHAAGIVHRDLKPANLFLTHRADGSPVVKVLDFGISKLVDDGDAEAGPRSLTSTAMTMGSPHYMAPEQMASTKDADARSDIWSLGVIVHVLLSGAPPFEGNSLIEVFESILEGPPPLRTVRADAPEELEAAVLRCLRREPADRYQDVAAFALAIAPFGDAGAQASADRIARVTRAAGREPVSSLLPRDEAPPRSADRSGPTSPARPRPGAAEPPGVDAQTAKSSPALPQSRRLPPPRGPSTGTGLVAVAVVLAVGFAVFFFTRSGPAQPSTVPIAASTATSSPAPEKPSAPPAPEPSAAAPAPAPSAEPPPAPAAPAATAAPSPARAPSPAPRANAPTPPKPASPRKPNPSPDDLFREPR